MLRHRSLAVASTVALVALVAPATAATAQDGPTITSHVIESFDGTPIEATLFLPPGASDEAPVPLVLRTHGWGGTGETETSSGSDLDPMAGTLDRLLSEGYAVLTWDQRGFGCSGGEVRINDPDVEGRDVSALIDWAIEHAPIAAVDGDPIVGMTGGSYAGGIQLATAAVDDRLDALAPEIVWSDLRYSLYSGSVVNQGWVALLYSLGKATADGQGLSPECASGPHTGGLDPAIDQGVTEFITTGGTGPDTLDFFAKSSLLSYGQDRPVTVPTLVLQGSVDTLFDLTDGYRVYEHVRAQGVDARYVAFCGGHVACPASYTDAGDRAHLDDAIITWFARHLRGEDVDSGSPVEYRTNDGEWRSATELPGPDAPGVPVTGEAEQLPVVPIVDVPDRDATLDLLAPPSGIPALPTTAAVPTPDGDPRGVTFPVVAAEDGPLEVLGIPRVALTVSGEALPLDQVLGPISDDIEESGALEQVGEVLVGSLGPFDGIVAGLGGASAIGGLDTPTVHVFVKFIHREAGEVINLQEGAIAVDLSAGEVTLDVPMPGLAYSLPEGDHIDVQVATNSLMHATGRVPALIDVSLEGSLPLTGSATLPDAGGDGGDGTDGGAGTDGGDGTDTDVATDDLDGVDAVPVAAQEPLPATGGAGTGLALLALLAALALRGLSRRSPSPGARA